MKPISHSVCVRRIKRDVQYLDLIRDFISFGENRIILKEEESKVEEVGERRMNKKGILGEKVALEQEVVDLFEEKERLKRELQKE